MTERGVVAIIGSGAGGMSIAVELAQQGIQVWLVEREAVLGGRTAGFMCKATDRCQQCLACRVHQLLDEARRQPTIQWLLPGQVVAVQQSAAGYSVTVQQAESSLILTVDAVVLAVGADVFSPQRRGEYGYGVYPGVLTGADLEHVLASGSALSGLPAGLERIGFIQCVGSRDTALGRGYCSQVCCQTSLRQAGLLRSAYLGTEINIFYLDLQSPPDLRKRCQEHKINLIRGLPSRVYNRADGRLGLKLDPDLAIQTAAEPYDLIVLACGMVPVAGLEKLADWCSWPLNDYGFLIRQYPRSFRGPKPGIFAAGACLGPRNIGQSLADGQAAAIEIISWLKSCRSSGK